MPKSTLTTCCNLYFYYNFIVHGGIRHLENNQAAQTNRVLVHGGIRHLETDLLGVNHRQFLFMAVYAI